MNEQKNDDVFHIKQQWREKPTNVRIINVRPNTHRKIRLLSKSTNIPTYKLASDLIEWALERVEISEYTENDDE
ncbi:hypothetical protein [Leuconostoc gasicomitatum]|uniref:hypothetical protein n=1 Tax=Leuconostoc gasicomitatum TaxID=115778 RepID=UPI001CC4E26B|nr:hypothetical protein [Leuconostoc gasicomitatum]MBZ5946059.1 hypothetical protein [Leuconostoc gasicomitatum]